MFIVNWPAGQRMLQSNPSREDFREKRGVMRSSGRVELSNGIPSFSSTNSSHSFRGS